MPLAITPARTCAVVVGIERYAAGDPWNLDGPASDATRFVEWLCAKGVPPENILVLLSPLKENQALNEHLRQRGIQPLDASHDPLVDAFTHRLPCLEGELLLLFWGGHGVTVCGEKRRLFCANATAAHLQSIDLDDLLARLRSRACSRFKQQIGIVDTCANYFEEMRSKLSLAESGFSKGEPDRDIKQFVLYGAATGELAGNNSIRKTGPFSEVVLETLSQDPHWPPDIRGLRKKVKDHFEHLRRQGKARQTPVYFQWQLADEGGGIVGDRPVSGKVQIAVRELGLAVPQLRKLAKTVLDCPSLADNKQWSVLYNKLPSELKTLIRLDAETTDFETELIKFFAIIWNDEKGMEGWRAALQGVERNRGAFRAIEDKIDCLRQVNEVRRRLGDLMITTLQLRQFYRRSAPDPQRAPEADDLDQVLENLWDMAPRTGGGISPLLEFVERLAQCYNRADLSDLVKDAAFSPQQAADLRRYLEEEKADAAATREYLLIDIPSASNPLEYWFHSWNRERDIHEKVEPALRVEKIPATLADILDNIDSIRTGELFIELFVPLELLSCEADRWEIECYGIRSALGALYPVLLRWRDRALNKPRTRASEWREVARKIRERESAGRPLAVCWVEPNQLTPPQLMSRIGLGNYGGYVSFLFLPVDLGTAQVNDLLRATLLGGAPFAFWARETPPDWQEFKRIMQNVILVAGGLDYVPYQVKKLRARAHNPSHPDYALTLFWDDPDRNPLAVPYPATIPQRGAL